MSTSTLWLRGRTPTRPKGPKQYEPHRVCANSGCATKLSRYNHHDVCFAHAPLVYPRNRGRTT